MDKRKGLAREGRARKCVTEPCRSQTKHELKQHNANANANAQNNTNTNTNTNPNKTTKTTRRKHQHPSTHTNTNRRNYTKTKTNNKPTPKVIPTNPIILLHNHIQNTTNIPDIPSNSHSPRQQSYNVEQHILKCTKT